VTGLARPTPYTWTVADIFTAAIGNGVRDGLTFAQNPPLFLGTQSTAQSLGNSTWVAMGLDTSQSDTYSGHSNTVNNSRYVPQQPGWYLAAGVVAFALNATGARAARLQMNGSAIKGAAGMTQSSGGANDCAIVSPTRPIFCNGTTDYIEVAGWQGSGGALNSATDPDLSSSLAVWWCHA
jgi:hypothetical protein